MFAFVGLVLFALVGLNVWAIVDVARRPDHEWRAIGQERTLWLVLTLLAGLPCSLAYLVAIRPRLDAVPAQLALPGWYPDPALPGYLRWHDGASWTAHAMPMLPPAWGHPHPYPASAPPPGWPHA